MIGILAGLGIFTPFATDSNCKNDTSSNSTLNAKISFEDNFWNENKVFIPAVVLTIVFIIMTVLLLIFVKEDKGTLSFKKSRKIKILVLYKLFKRV